MVINVGTLVTQDLVKQAVRIANTPDVNYGTD